MSPRKDGMPPTGSPLSPKMQSLAVPSSGRRVRPSMAQGRQPSSGTAACLRLNSLPRFHPANFPSRDSSTAPTPATGPNSPQPPLSPRAYQQQYSEAQRQMYMSFSPGIQSRGPLTKPTSPRLNPMGSPGPVTPLELEGSDGYLTAGVSVDDATSHVDNLIREEARRRNEQSSAATVGGR